jgi:hypothetical protein
MIIYYIYLYEVKFSINSILKNKIKKIYSIKIIQVNLINLQNSRSELRDRDNPIKNIKLNYKLTQ